MGLCGMHNAKLPVLARGGSALALIRRCHLELENGADEENATRKPLPSSSKLLIFHVKMELQDMMNTSLQIFPIPAGIRNQIQAAFWEPKDVADALKGRPSADYYFDTYYSPRCQHFAREGGRHISARTHSDIAQIASWILQDQSRDDIRSRLLDQITEQGPTEKAIETSIDMCASLLGMVECGKQEFVFSGRNPILWAGGSLRDCLAQRFPAQTTLDARNLRLTKGFTGRSLSRIGGIKIKWTTNLVDHLLLTDDDQAVFIFQSPSFLMMQKQWVFHVEIPART